MDKQLVLLFNHEWFRFSVAQEAYQGLSRVFFRSHKHADRSWSFICLFMCDFAFASFMHGPDLFLMYNFMLTDTSTHMPCHIICPCKEIDFTDLPVSSSFVFMGEGEGRGRDIRPFLMYIEVTSQSTSHHIVKILQRSFFPFCLPSLLASHGEWSLQPHQQCVQSRLLMG